MMWFGGLLMGIGISLMTLPMLSTYLVNQEMLTACKDKGQYIIDQTVITCEVKE
jgi:hypothetical protein